MARSKPKGGFRSTFEYDFSKHLSRKKIKFGYETESIQWTPPVTTKNYWPDFVLDKKDGTKLYLENKGCLTVDDRKKMLCVKQQNPELDIRFVFQNAKAKIRKGSKTTVSMWAEKNGFLWCESVLPVEWEKEIKK